MTSLPQDVVVVEAAACETTVVEREETDAAYVADLLGVDDEDDAEDEVDDKDDKDEVDDNDEADEVETDEVEADDQFDEDHETFSPTERQAKEKARVREERQAHESRVLDSGEPIEDLIAWAVSTRQQQLAADLRALEERLPGASNQVHDMTGLSLVDSATWEVRDLRRQLEAALVCPWPVRPAHRSTKLSRWQRLRVLRVLGGLRSCGACSGYGSKHSSRCQVAQLRTLSMQIGGLDFWLDQPRRVGDAVDARWPEVLKPALWKRLRALRAEVRSVADMSRGPAAHAAAKRSAADATAPLGTDPRPAADARPAGAVPVAHSAPTHVGNTSADRLAARASITVGLPIELIDRRAELGDHALYVLSLVALPHHRDIDEHGWRPLEHERLQRTLGAHRVDGKIVHRVSEVLGAPERPGRPGRPGLLERLGLIERRPGYLASKTKGYPQHYRLADQSLRAAARDGVELVLRERGNLPERERREGRPVHSHLSSSHAHLVLDYQAALADLCVRAGVEISSDPAVISAAIGALDPPKPVQTKSGKLAAKQPDDPRRGWQAELVGLEHWALPDDARRHELHRDATVGRLWSPLSSGSLPREARQFLTLAGRPLVWLDIRGAGLVLRAAEMRRDGATADPDCRAWIEMVEGEDPYTVLHVLVHGHAPATEDDRSAWKKVVFRDLFYSTIADQLRSELGQAVRRQWPGYFDYLLAKKREVGHAEFACQAQRLEAAIVIDALPPVFEAEGIKLVTKHDAIGVRDVDADRARALFEGVLREAGVQAVIR